MDFVEALRDYVRRRQDTCVALQLAPTAREQARLRAEIKRMDEDWVKVCEIDMTERRKKA